MIPVVLATLRRRKAEVLVVALVTALLLGGGLAALAGARRSTRAVDRFIAYTHPEDAFVAPPGSDQGTPDPQLMAAVNKLPQILAANWQGYLAMTPVEANGHVDLNLAGSINPYLYAPVIGPRDAIGRDRVLAGRDVHLDAPLEVDIDRELAHSRHLHVGSTLRMATYGPDQIEQVFATGGQIQPDGPRVDLHVVGIVRTPADVHPGESEHSTSYGGTKDLYLTPAFFHRYGDQIVSFGGPQLGQPEAIRLRHGAADLAAFTKAIRALPDGPQTVIQRGASDNLDSARTAKRAISVETTSLLGLAGVLLAAGLVLLAQAAARMAQRTTNDLGVLRTMGLRPRQLLAVAAAPSLLAVGAATVLSIVVAVAASPLLPVGLAREADIDVGVHLDLLVVGLGVIAIALIGTGLAILTALPTVRTIGRAGTPRRSARPGLTDRLARFGAPLTSALGAHLATDRRGGERSAPLRSAVVAGAMALTVLVGVATYTSSLHRLAATPAAEGITWDLTIGNPNLQGYTTADVKRLERDPMVAAVTAVAAPQGQATIRTRTVSIAGVDPAHPASPVISGRLPRSTGEVALGRHTADALHVHLGDTIPVALDTGTKQLTVVGTALLNPGLNSTMQIGDGALVTLDEMNALEPDQSITFLLTRLRPGVDVDHAIASLHHGWGKDVSKPPLAVDVLNLDRVREIPQALAFGLGAGAATLLAFTLIVSVTHRRQELSVLRAIGVSGRQLSATLTWQAIWLYGAGAVVGIPLCVIAGRLAMPGVDHLLGADTTPVVPILPVAVVAGAGLVLSMAIAVVPARSARHTRFERQD